jgi:hypothetical protein
MHSKSKWIFLSALVGVIAIGVWWGQQSTAQKQLPDRFRPVSESAIAEAPVITERTDVYFTQEYLRSEVTVVSGLPGKEALLGKRREEIETLYPAAEGYSVAFDGRTLQVKQQIDDWAPSDKLKYRLKVYQDWLAVYQGPDAEQDVLVRVTGIRLDSLPEDVQAQVANGSYEFLTQAELNDVLENFDEFS